MEGNMMEVNADMCKINEEREEQKKEKIVKDRQGKSRLKKRENGKPKSINMINR